MKGYRLILCYLLAVLVFVLVLMCVSCSTTKYVPVETVKRDTVWENHTARDSIYIHDSVYVREWLDGDTVYRDRDRWHTKYVEKEVHDTLYRSKVDSVAVPYPVEKELSWWEKKKIEFGEVMLVVLCVMVCFVVIRRKLR